MNSRVLVLAGCLSLAVALASWTVVDAQDSENDELIDLVAQLLSDSDKDMRALGLEQIRTKVPGEAATQKFAAQLPKLAPDVQVELISALTDRRDAAARPPSCNS